MARPRHFKALGFLVALCFLLLIPATLAWLVNLEISLQAGGIPCTLLGKLIPARLYEALAIFATDLSTISTFVPLLLLAFPIFMGLRIRVLATYDPGYLHRVVYDPYPPHFPFFLVMLGLTGTLYGLLIGLSVSGVSELGGGTPTAGAIQETIDRLMGGTATALLSSLLGLVGAFLAARPFPWLFRTVAGIEEAETQRTVTDVIAALTRDLQSLSHASREFSEHLNVASAESINDRLTQIENSLTLLAQSVGESTIRFQRLLEVQEQIAERMEPMKHLTELLRLEEIGQATTAASERFTETHEALEKLRAEQENTRLAADRRAEEFERGRAASQQSLDGIRALIDDSNRDSREDRSALRNALGSYIQNLMEKSE